MLTLLWVLPPSGGVRPVCGILILRVRKSRLTGGEGRGVRRWAVRPLLGLVCWHIVSFMCELRRGDQHPQPFLSCPRANVY